MIQREKDKLEVRQIAKTRAIIGICKWASILLIIILFALPLVKIDLFLTEKNVSMLDITLAKNKEVEKAEDLTDLILLEIMADFVGDDEYTGLSSLPSSVVKGEDLGNGLADIPAIFKGIVKMFITVGSLSAIIVYAAAAVKTIIVRIMKARVYRALERVDDYTFVNLFRYGRDRRSGLTFARIKFDKWLIILNVLTLAVFAYFPIKLAAFLNAEIYITVNILWYIMFYLFLASYVALWIVEYVYTINNSQVLSGCDTIKRSK